MRPQNNFLKRIVLPREHHKINEKFYNPFSIKKSFNKMFKVAARFFLPVEEKPLGGVKCSAVVISNDVSQCVDLQNSKKFRAFSVIPLYLLKSFTHSFYLIG